MKTIPRAAIVLLLALLGFESRHLMAGQIWAWGSDDFVDTYGQIANAPTNGNFTAVAAGGFHGVALLADGSVVAWGDNTYGQTNVPANATNVVAVDAGYVHNVALRADGTVVA